MRSPSPPSSHSPRSPKWRAGKHGPDVRPAPGTPGLGGPCARRNLLKAAIDLQNGIEPWLANHPEAYRVRAMDVNTAIETLDQVMEQHGQALVATATV